MNNNLLTFLPLFYSIFRKVKNKIRNWEFEYNSKLELLEAYYIISVMEEYSATPPPPEDPRRKRGRDFMYTLIQDLKELKLEEYKNLLELKMPLKTSIEAQLQEILNTIPIPSQSQIANIPIPEVTHTYPTPQPKLKPRILSSTSRDNPKLPPTSLMLPPPHRATPIETLIR